jgi:hypothetical protein
MAVAELTEREITIAQGLDPDAVDSSVEQDADSDVAADPVSVQAEETVTNEADAVSEGSEEVGKEAPASADWLDDSTREVALSYGLSEDEVKEFSSQAEFNRFSRMMDKQFTSLGSQKIAPKQEPVAPQESNDLDLSKFDPETYDPETIQLVKYAKETREELNRIKQETEVLMMAQRQVEQTRQVNEFHNVVDSLGDDRFGKTVDESGNIQPLSAAANELRKRVFESAAILAAGIIKRAEDAGTQANLPPMPVLVKRAYQMEFAQDIAARERKSVQNKITAQSKLRRPVAGHRGVAAAPAAGRDEAQRLASNPAIVKAWKQFHAENGTE